MKVSPLFILNLILVIIERNSCLSTLNWTVFVVSEQTSPSTVLYGNEPSESWWACNTHN